MSVFTTVTPDQFEVWLKNYSLGALTELQGIAAGIENTNYFVTTTTGRYVLTLFEKLKPHELPFYLNLMAHLAHNGVPCPAPIANNTGAYLGELNGKPASLVTRLSGKDIAQPSVDDCAQVGAVLAHMHIAGQSYPAKMNNPRGPHWWTVAQSEVLPFLPAEEAAMLRAEIREQAAHRHDELPRGAIHADLFRDNILFDNGRIEGIIDFYFACTDVLLYDVAITVNDWCMDAQGMLHAARTHALLNAYHVIRPFTAVERGAWTTLLRAGALRFWVSRLYDLHLPRAGEMTHAKDPAHFRRILAAHVAHEQDLPHLPA